VLALKSVNGGQNHQLAEAALFYLNRRQFGRISWIARAAIGPVIGGFEGSNSSNGPERCDERQATIGHRQTWYWKP
jgi:hypothetical protein